MDAHELLQKIIGKLAEMPDDFDERLEDGDPLARKLDEIDDLIDEYVQQFRPVP